jgi:hypothetical protein
VGDHLKPAGSYPESLVVLAAAAAVIERIDVGVGVMVLALRDLQPAAHRTTSSVLPRVVRASIAACASLAPVTKAIIPTDTRLVRTDEIG